MRTELARPGYRVQAIASNSSPTTVVTGTVSSPSSLPLLPFTSEAVPVLTLFWVIAALGQVQTLTVSAFAMYGCCADKPVSSALILFRTETCVPDLIFNIGQC